MDDMKTQEGIDFFDFLYEMWQAKWIFIVVFLVPVFLAGAYSIVFRPKAEPPINMVSHDTIENDFLAVVPFTIDPIFEPYRRSSEELWQNLKTFLPKDIDGIPLVDDNSYPAGTERPDYIYKAEFSKFNGFLYLRLKGGNLEIAENIRNAFNAAARLQIENTFLQLKSDINTLENVPKKIGIQENELYFKEYYLYSRFLNLPDVVNGEYRFLKFEPALEKPQSENQVGQVSVAGSPNNSFIKMIILGAIGGFILACVAVMFRIAIKRRKFGPAKA